MTDKWFTRKSIVTMLLTASIGSVTAYADELPISVSQSANEAAQDEVTQRTLLVNKTAKKVADVRAALMAYYSDKLAWPVPLSAMVTAGYYPAADWSTPFGNITGAVSGNNYVLSLVLPSGARASPIGKLIAAKADGTATGTNNTNLTFTLGTPSQATLVKNMLSRISDPANPNGNTMETALNMGGNNILNIGQADIQVLNGGTVSVTGKTTTNELDVAGVSSLSDVNAKNVLIKGTNTVNGISTLNGATTVNNTLHVVGKTTLADTDIANVVVKGTQTVNGLSVLNGATTIKNTLNVTGKATLADIEAVNALIKGSHTVNGISTLNGATTVNDDFFVTGKSSLADTTVNNLIVKGNQTVVGATVLNGSLSAGQTTVSGMTVSGLTRLNGDLLGTDATFSGDVFANTITANAIGYKDGTVYKDVATEINALHKKDGAQDLRLASLEGWKTGVDSDLSSLKNRMSSMESWKNSAVSILANHENRIATLENRSAADTSTDTKIFQLPYMHHTIPRYEEALIRSINLGSESYPRILILDGLRLTGTFSQYYVYLNSTKIGDNIANATLSLNANTNYTLNITASRGSVGYDGLWSEANYIMLLKATLY